MKQVKSVSLQPSSTTSALFEEMKHDNERGKVFETVVHPPEGLSGSVAIIRTTSGEVSLWLSARSQSARNELVWWLEAESGMGESDLLWRDDKGHVLYCTVRHSQDRVYITLDPAPK